MSILTPEEKQSIRLRSRIRYALEPPGKVEISIALEAAYVIIGKTLGREWLEKNASPTPGENSLSFMKRALGSQQDNLIHTDRAIMLAEFLNNLYKLQNFSSKLKDLNTKGLEETLFELQVANSLNRQGHLTEFVIPQGVRGLDYDLEAALNDQQIHIEIKCGKSQRIFSEATLKNTLKRAAEQLPKQGPNAIFYKIPGQWPKESDFPLRSKTVIEKFLTRSSRVNAVFLFWEEWVNRGVPPFARLYRFVTLLNSKPRLFVGGIEKIIKDEGAGVLYTRRNNRLGISFI